MVGSFDEWYCTIIGLERNLDKRSLKHFECPPSNIPAPAHVLAFTDKLAQ